MADAYAVELQAVEIVATRTADSMITRAADQPGCNTPKEVTSQRERFFIVVWLLFAVCTSVPQIVYPHFLSFALPLLCWTFLCWAFLCVSAAVMYCRRSDGGKGPSLHDTGPGTSRDFSTRSRESSARRRSSVAVSEGSTSINVIDIDRLQSAIQSSSAEAVLSQLYDTSELLRPMRIGKSGPESSYAIISYRQVRSKRDPFTLDVDAFRSAINRAQDAKVDALWLDGWCYRQEGEYNHAAFCAELATVMRHVAAVIWLPVSRTNAPPSYQFRMWCSFEANVVARRKLPVYIAGKGLRRSQAVLRRFGRWMPALPGLPPPAEVRTMAYVNFGFEFCCVLMPLFIPMVLIFIWSGFLARLIPQYGQDHALARHGQQVLRTMHEGVERGNARLLSFSSTTSTQAGPHGVGGHEKQSTAEGGHGQEMNPSSPQPTAEGGHFVQQLAGESLVHAHRLIGLVRQGTHFLHQDVDEVHDMEKLLPWLPAFDRRDALVVWTLLRVLSDKARNSSELLLEELDSTEAKLALAASCYTAALITPSDGDAVGSLDVVAWLQQKHIVLPMERSLSLSRLDHFGWQVFRGCPDVLTCPAGMLTVSTPPSGLRWDASSMRPVAEVPVVMQVGGILSCLIGTGTFFLVLEITLAIDLSSWRDGERRVLDNTVWGLSFSAPFALLGNWRMFLEMWPLRWLWNYPRPVHGATLSPSSFTGYHALIELGAWLVLGYFIGAVFSAALVVIDTSAFSEHTKVFSVFSHSYTAELARAAHPGVEATPVAYGALLGIMHFWQLPSAVSMALTTWHMWHCGVRNGARHVLTSPDSKTATVVSFASPHAACERESSGSGV